MDFEAYLRDRCQITLNAQQREAVFTTDGPVLLLAVPGSGKTTVVAARTAYMAMEKGIPPESMLTLTFNRSARIDMEARFTGLFGGDCPSGVRFATIHSFCYSVLRQYGELVGRQVPRLIEDGKARLLRGIHGQFNGPEYLPDDRLEELANAIGYAKNRMMTSEQIKEAKWGVQNFAGIFEAYEAYKNDNGAMDFDDMLDKALAAFRVRPALLESFRRRYRYVSVDEAQDVSRLQHEIIRLMAAPRNNLFMVGDEDQSIYGFRAAEPEYLLQFRQAYPEGKVLLMERNYRSTAAVVAAAGRLIRKNKARHAKSMEAGGQAGPPVADVVLDGNGSLPSHIVSRLSENQAGTTAVLFRENGSAVALMDALGRAGIPFHVREHRADLFSHRAVRDALAFLALANNPTDIAALRQVYWKLGAGISRSQFDKAAELYAQHGGGSAIGALLALPGLKETAAARIKAVQRELAALRDMPVGDAVPFILERLFYRQHLKKAFGDGYALQASLCALESLGLIAAHTPAHEDLLRRIAALTALAALGGSGGTDAAVTLSTVHSAKGLEFDRVIVTDLYEGRFPSASAIAELKAGNPAPMEEERRLFYVAVTRARRDVELVTAKTILHEKAAPSRFIAEALPNAPLRRALESHLKKRPAPAIGSGDTGERAIEIGMQVRNKSFGTGVVTQYDAERRIVTVQFPKYGRKQIAEEFCDPCPAVLLPPKYE